LVDDLRLVILSQTLHSSHNLWSRPFADTCAAVNCTEQETDSIDFGACERHLDNVLANKTTRRRRKKRAGEGGI